MYKIFETVLMLVLITAVWGVAPMLGPLGIIAGIGLSIMMICLLVSIWMDDLSGEV